MSDLFNFPTLYNPAIFDKFFVEGNRDLFSVRSDYPYNIVQGEKSVRIEYALAGFAKDEITVKVEDNKLLINASAKAKEEGDQEEKKETYLHHGIAKRSLYVRFDLGPKVAKTNIKSSYVNGLLVIDIPLKEKEVIDISVA